MPNDYFGKETETLQKIGIKNLEQKIKELEREKNKIEKMIENLQKDYFQKNKIKRKVYDERIRSLTETIADIEKNITILKSKQKRRR